MSYKQTKGKKMLDKTSHAQVQWTAYHCLLDFGKKNSLDNLASNPVILVDSSSQQTFA